MVAKSSIIMPEIKPFKGHDFPCLLIHKERCVIALFDDIDSGIILHSLVDREGSQWNFGVSSAQFDISEWEKFEGTLTIRNED